MGDEEGVGLVRIAGISRRLRSLGADDLRYEWAAWSRLNALACPQQAYAPCHSGRLR